jgi:membrane protease YdiL (CAAX protease family)
MDVAQSSQPTLLFRYATVILTCLAAPVLLALPELKWLGWTIVCVVAVLMATKYRSLFAKHTALILIGLTILGFMPIDTRLGYNRIATWVLVMSLTIGIPYLATRFRLKDRAIRFPFTVGRAWYKKEIAYILFAGLMAYLLLPYYLASTGSYLNWHVQANASEIIRLFVGTNGLAIWDELFFICVCLALLRKHLPFWAANLAQAALWTTFLYELGFRGWGPIAIFVFALSQGVVFKNTKSLLYIITVHLTIDFVLFLVLIHLHHPQYLNIFVTSPF